MSHNDVYSSVAGSNVGFGGAIIGFWDLRGVHEVSAVRITFRSRDTLVTATHFPISEPVSLEDRMVRHTARKAKQSASNCAVPRDIIFCCEREHIGNVE